MKDSEINRYNEILTQYLYGEDTSFTDVKFHQSWALLMEVAQKLATEYNTTVSRTLLAYESMWGETITNDIGTMFVAMSVFTNWVMETESIDIQTVKET